MTNPTATKRKTETQSKKSWTAINVADKPTNNKGLQQTIDKYVKEQWTQVLQRSGCLHNNFLIQKTRNNRLK